ncbi:MAG: hypothetical protein QRY72_04220 [Candidatus Rhabdochlamydia sp.]
MSLIINPNHELGKLAHTIPWEIIDEGCFEYFTIKASCLPILARGIIGILMLQNISNLSDGRGILIWVEH